KPVEQENIPSDIRSRYFVESPEGDPAYRIEVFPAQPIFDVEDMRDFSDAVLAIAPNATDDPVTIPATGDAVVDAFIQASILAFILCFLLVYFLLRRWWEVFVVFVPIALGTILIGSIL